MALTIEAARVSRIPYVMDAYRQEAEAILDDLDSQEYDIDTIPLGEPTAILRLLREGSRRQRIPILS